MLKITTKTEYDRALDRLLELQSGSVDFDDTDMEIMEELEEAIADYEETTVEDHP